MPHESALSQEPICCLHSTLHLCRDQLQRAAPAGGKALGEAAATMGLCGAGVGPPREVKGSEDAGAGGFAGAWEGPERLTAAKGSENCAGDGCDMAPNGSACMHMQVGCTSLEIILHQAPSCWACNDSAWRVLQYHHEPEHECLTGKGLNGSRMIQDIWVGRSIAQLSKFSECPPANPCSHIVYYIILYCIIY